MDLSKKTIKEKIFDAIFIIISVPFLYFGLTVLYEFCIYLPNGISSISYQNWTWDGAIMIVVYLALTLLVPSIGGVFLFTGFHMEKTANIFFWIMSIAFALCGLLIFI